MLEYARRSWVALDGGVEKCLALAIEESTEKHGPPRR
jgi:hypothetical protein